MRRAYKFRLYPNRNQERELGIMLETHRRLYNACLGQRRSVYEKDKISVSYGEQSAWFKNQRAVNPWFATGCSVHLEGDRLIRLPPPDFFVSADSKDS